jgi:arginase
MMRRPTLIEVPYHLGRPHVGLGKGVPVLSEALAGEASEVVTVDPGPEATNEVAASMAVIRALAREVRGVVAGGGFPFVLAGNCNSSLGTIAALGDGVGVIWFDAHADFNTPDSTPTGFFDGFGLAMLTGSGWRVLRESVKGLHPIPEEHVVLAGARDIDPKEQERLDASRVRAVEVADLAPALDGLGAHVDSAYVHIDLDVLDPSVGRANSLTVEGGPQLAELADAIDLVAERFVVRAAALTAYEPDFDPEQAIPAAARVLFERLCAGASRVAA